MRYSRNSTYYESLRQWLTKKRSEAGLTIRELANKLDVPHSIIGKIEDGTRKLEILEFIEICHVLEVDPHEGIEVLVQILKSSKSQFNS